MALVQFQNPILNLYKVLARHALHTLHALASGFPVVAITGPRQSGKTTLARSAFGQLPYVNLEDPDTRELALADPRRFFARHPDGAVLDEVQRAPQLMAYLGLVPSEYSSGPKQKRGGITKTGNGHVRRVLVESAWAYRHPARKTAVLQRRAGKTSAAVQDIAWKAQTRLCSRYKKLEGKGKLKVQACTAVARELAGFIWAIGQAMPQPKTSEQTK